MHFLIIDNGTSSLDQIKELLKEETFEVLSFNNNFLSTDLGRFNAIILSGGHLLMFEDHQNDFEKEKDIILNSNLPIFGICFGFQMIARVYGAKLKKMDASKKGVLKININSDDPLFENIKEFKVFENHRIVVKEVSDQLIPLAYSKDGIEIIKHKNKMIYGVQFHPETAVEKTCGGEIFRNFIKIIKA